MSGKKAGNRGRRGKYEDWLTEDGLLKVQGWARDGLSNEQIAHNIGINKDTLYEWQKRFSDFSDALKKGKEVVDREVENALLKRALGYEYDEVTQEPVTDKDTGITEMRVTKRVTDEARDKADCAGRHSSDLLAQESQAGRVPRQAGCRAVRSRRPRQHYREGERASR